MKGQELARSGGSGQPLSKRRLGAGREEMHRLLVTNKPKEGTVDF